MTTHPYRFPCGYCPSVFVIHAAGMKLAFEIWEANEFKCEKCRAPRPAPTPMPQPPPAILPLGAEWGETL